MEVGTRAKGHFAVALGIRPRGLEPLTFGSGGQTQHHRSRPKPRKPTNSKGKRCLLFLVDFGSCRCEFRHNSGTPPRFTEIFTRLREKNRSSERWVTFWDSGSPHLWVPRPKIEVRTAAILDDADTKSSQTFRCAWILVSPAREGLSVFEGLLEITLVP
jgi:hypothetical protein